MNIHVYIVRHAEIVYPLDSHGRRLMYPPETRLSDDGKAQMERFAKKLRDAQINFDRIETSPHIRAIESAQILADIMETQEIIKNKAFTDSYVPGWYGVPLSEQQKLMDQGEDIYLNPRSTDQEKYENIAERMFLGFKDLLKRSEGKTVALVSHGDPIRLLLYRLEHPEEKIPNMSILSKEGYLKRGEAFHIVVNEIGNVVESNIVVGREGVPGKRELY